MKAWKIGQKVRKVRKRRNGGCECGGGGILKQQIGAFGACIIII